MKTILKHKQSMSNLVKNPAKNPVRRALLAWHSKRQTVLQKPKVLVQESVLDMHLTGHRYGGM